MKIPEYYLPLMPYLGIEKTDEFIKFLKAVFGAEERLVTLREDGTIMHAEYSFGKATIMFAATNEQCKARSCAMFVLREDVDEVYRKALENGAVSLQNIEERDYGRSAGFQDFCGNEWWVTKPD